MYRLYIQYTCNTYTQCTTNTEFRNSCNSHIIYRHSTILYNIYISTFPYKGYSSSRVITSTYINVCKVWTEVCQTQNSIIWNSCQYFGKCILTTYNFVVWISALTLENYPLTTLKTYRYLYLNQKKPLRNYFLNITS